MNENQEVVERLTEEEFTALLVRLQSSSPETPATMSYALQAGDAVPLPLTFVWRGIAAVKETGGADAECVILSTAGEQYIMVLRAFKDICYRVVWRCRVAERASARNISKPSAKRYFGKTAESRIEAAIARDSVRNG